MSDHLIGWLLGGYFMKHTIKIKQLATASMLAALCCVATLIVQIPSPTQGYIHLGDAIVLLSGWLLGPIWGAMAAGLGSALADIFAGYILYAPATFFIKAAVAALGWLLFSAFSQIMHKHNLLALVLSGILSETIMVVGYLGFEAFFVGYGGAAIVGVPLNIVQAIFGVAVGALLKQLLKRIHFRIHRDYNIK